MKYRNSILAVFLIISLFLISNNTYIATDNESQTVYDYHTGKEYSVSYADKNIHIRSSEKNVSFPFESEEFSSLVYDGVFVFIARDPLTSPDSGSSVYTVFDSETRYLFSFASDTSVSLSPTLFACDEDYNIYLCSDENHDILYKFAPDYSTASVDLSSSIGQIMCHEGKILLITADGVFTLAGDTPQKLSSNVISTPCVMNGDNELISADSRLYRFESDTLTEVKETTPTDSENTEGSEDYGVTVNGNLIFANHGTTVANLRKALNLKSEDIAVIKTDGKVISSGKLGTGMMVLYEGGEKFIIIKGELTGEGNINSRDLKLMMKFLTGETSPDEITEIAADLDGDSPITIRDLLLLSKMY